MIPNLYLEIASVIAIIMLIISLIARNQMKGCTNMLFLAMCICALVSGITDIFTSYFDFGGRVDAITYIPRYVANYIYFLFRNFTMPLYVLFVASATGIFHRITNGKWLHILWAIPYCVDVLFILTNPITHAIFTIDRNTYIYSRGPLIGILYIVVVYYVILATALLVYTIHTIDRRKWTMLFLFIPMNIMAVIVMFLLPEYRVEIPFTVITMIMIIVGIQRPEETIDPVVGVLSNAVFYEDIEQSYKTERPLNILLIHVRDTTALRNNLGFFTYNDLMRKIADKLVKTGLFMKVYPDVYCYENGSFAIVTDTRHEENFIDMARMLNSYLKEPIRIRGMEVVLDVALCLLKCPEDLKNLDAFKSFVKNFHEKLPKTEKVDYVGRISEEKDFRIKTEIDAVIGRGIENHSFKMYYQPIYDIKTKKFRSAEALIRLIDDELGFVSPGIFIPAAEESGAIHQIGDFVIEDVCRFINEGELDKYGVDYVEINLSVSQCVEMNLAEKIKGFLEKHDVSSERINLEITETAVDYDSIMTDKNIKALHDMGISFSLDDYGTGYSNIKRLVSLPLNIVKLDKCLVDEMNDKRMWIVIKNTVKMLKKLNKKILVEGVETEEALEKFAEIGCDYIQGFYFSKPLPEEDYIAFLKEHNLGLD